MYWGYEKAMLNYFTKAGIWERSAVHRSAAL